MVSTPIILTLTFVSLLGNINRQVDAADCSQLYATKCLAKLPNPTQAPVVVYDGDDAIYVFGGSRRNLPYPSVYSNEILKYTISTDTIKLVAHLPLGLFLGTVTADGLGNYFYFGGAYSLGDSNYYSTSFAYNQSMAYVTSGNYLQNGVIKFDMQTYTWSKMADLPTLYRTAFGFWDKSKEKAYLFGLGNAHANPPYDHVGYYVTPDHAQIEHFNIPNDDLEYSAVTNDERDGFIVGRLKQTNSLFWYQLQTGDGKYCPVSGLPGNDDVLLGGTGVALVPKLKRVYVFGGASRNLTTGLATTHDGIWHIDVDM
ncbi:hypothetical protein Fcan01_25877 [Folsomia candida]|uniref:Uncharacterized protein n=1 Tax=Folsomia candida TaxID=158441 RepID=A0A226D1B2_FOLCA|nr:hypothetical protein Fcan01_25877 [Folsomia candida]